MLPACHRGVAQLAEHRSPKPGVASSSPTAPAIYGDTSDVGECRCRERCSDSQFDYDVIHVDGSVSEESVGKRQRGCVAAFVQELFRFGLYKRSQGRIARQVTFGVAGGDRCAWRLGCLSDSTTSESDWSAIAAMSSIVPLAVLAVGLWASFRVVQMPSVCGFFDFRRSGDEQGLVAVAERSDCFALVGRDPGRSFSWRSCCLRTM